VLETRRTHRILVGISVGKKSYEGLSKRSEDVCKVDFREWFMYLVQWQWSCKQNKRFFFEWSVLQ